MGSSKADVIDNGDGSYTIKNVTGNLTITDTKTPKSYTVTVNGTGKDDVTAAANATYLTAYTFTLTKDDKYTIPGAKLTGTALTVTVEKTAKQTAEVNVYEYVKLNGKNIYLVTASGTVADGKVMAYDGSAMFWSEKYKAYAYLVISNTELTKAEAAKKVTQASAAKTELAYDGDVNLTGTVDVNDAQLVWNMYNAKYTDFSTVSMRKFLEADLNGDRKLTVLDAAAVITKMPG